MQTYLRLLTHSNLQHLFDEIEALYKPVRLQQFTGHSAGGMRHDTVRAHLKRIFAKLGVENRLSAALRALQILRSVPSPQE
jgi:hypothetical protein